MWEGGSHWGRLCGVSGVWRDGAVHPSAHHSLLPPPLPPSFLPPLVPLLDQARSWSWRRFLLARLSGLKDTQHGYDTNNHTDTFEKKTGSCYSCTESLPETSSYTQNHSEVLTWPCKEDAHSDSCLLPRLRILRSQPKCQSWEGLSWPLWLALFLPPVCL